MKVSLDMRMRTARWILAAAIIGSTALALRYRDGHDFTNNVWAPTRALVNGINPYDPGNDQYYDRYHVPVVAGPYTPAALTLFAPLALLSSDWATAIVAVLSAGLLWVGVLVLIPPRSTLGTLIAALTGVLVLLTAPAQDTLYLGQLSGVAFAGLALMVAALRRNPTATWLPAVGAALVALKPQSAVPIFVVLAVLGRWRILGRTVGMLALASIPVLVLFLRVAGSPENIVRIIGDNVNLLSRLPPGSLTNPTNLRIDLLGVLSHLQGPALTGLKWTGVAFIITTILFALVPLGKFDLDESPLGDAYVATVVGLYVAGSFYHLMYDQLLLYVGPVAAVGLIGARRDANPRVRIVALGGVLLLGAGLFFRVGVRALLVGMGVPNLVVHISWVTIPTLIGIAIVAGAPAYSRVVASRAALRIIRPAPSDGARG